MNLFLFEVRNQIKNALGWLSALLLVLVMFVGGIYPEYRDSMKEIRDLVSGFPKAFRQMFGMENLEEMFQFPGFNSFTFLYVGVLGGMMAVSIALSIFAREKRGKCRDYLLTKPASRSEIFLEKAFSGLFLLVLANLIYGAVWYLLYLREDEGVMSTTKLWLTMLALFLTQIVFWSIGTFWAVFARRIRSVSGTSVAMGIISFAIWALTNVLEKEELRFVSPLQYFSPETVFRESGYDGKLVIMAVFVTVFCLISAYVKFCREDIPAI